MMQLCLAAIHATVIGSTHSCNTACAGACHYNNKHTVSLSKTHCVQHRSCDKVQKLVQVILPAMLTYCLDERVESQEPLAAALPPSCAHLCAWLAPVARRCMTLWG